MTLCAEQFTAFAGNVVRCLGTGQHEALHMELLRSFEAQEENRVIGFDPPSKGKLQLICKIA